MNTNPRDKKPTSTDPPSSSQANTTASGHSTAPDPRGKPLARHGDDLLTRARAAREVARRAHPVSYQRRHDDWRGWTQRHTAATWLALTLGLPVDAVTAGDDPDRGYGVEGQFPGTLFLACDPGSGQTWRFIPEIGSEHSWLLLGTCPHCCAPAVPVAHIAGLVDLGAWHDEQPADRLPASLQGDPTHDPGCPAARGRIP